MESSGASIVLKGQQNWNVWKFQTRIVLESKGLFEAVKGLSERKTAETEEAYTARQIDFSKKNLKAQEVMVSRVEDGPMAHLLTCESAQAMGEKLCSVYEHKSEISIHMLQRKFFNFKCSGEQDISEYISGLEDLRTQLKQRKEEITDQMFITKILMGLPPKFHYFITAWESVPSDKQSVNELISRLSIEEERTRNLLNDSGRCSETDPSSTDGCKIRFQVYTNGCKTAKFKCAKITFRCHKPGQFCNGCYATLLPQFCHQPPPAENRRLGIKSVALPTNTAQLRGIIYK